MRFRRRYEVVMLGHSGSATSQLSVISEHRSERDAREAAAHERRRLEVIHPEDAASWVIQVVRGEDVLYEERPFDGRADAAPVPPVGPLGLTQTDDPPRNADETPSPNESTATFPAVTATESDSPPPDRDQNEDRRGDTGALPVIDAGAVKHEADPTEDTADAPDERDAASAFALPDDLAIPEEGRPLEQFLAPTDTRPQDDDAPPAGAPADVAVDDDEQGATGRVAPPRFDPDAPRGRVPDDIIRRFEESIAREQARAADRESRRGR
ncbi:MAG TPA: hypothetical protein PKE32_01315 [Miltoncostaeaceae bacterium]|nr:hypothetical protein [Miltoncostaeaceae bacterium]